MKKKVSSNKNQNILYGAVGAGLVALGGWLIYRKCSQASSLRPADPQYAGASPKEAGAVSAVTGGNPEDMNQMPPVLDEKSENPIYDGSDLDTPNAVH